MTIYLAVFSLTMARAGSHLHHQVQTDTTDCDAGWLWTISGNSLQQKSYLFGTCHGDGHQFTAEEMFSISGLENTLGKVEKVLFEGGLDTTKCVMDSCHQGEYHSPSQYDSRRLSPPDRQQIADCLATTRRIYSRTNKKQIVRLWKLSESITPCGVCCS